MKFDDGTHCQCENVMGGGRIGRNKPAGLRSV